MKNIIINSILALVSFFLFLSCDNDNELEPWESPALDEYTVTPINGGAIITYSIPDDPDIKYIMAEYERNGQVFTEKATVYTNTMTIEGFHNTSSVKVKLYKVNKEDQLSKPLEIEFTPGESLVSIAQRTLTLGAAFGGIVASWENPNCTELGIRLMMEDSTTSKLETSDMYFSTLPKDKYTFRGYEHKLTHFAVTIEDKWGNVSDTIEITTTPYLETLVPKPYEDFRASIPYDNTTTHGAYYMSKLWDNIVNTSRNGWLTERGHSGRSFTIDIKCVTKLSRILVHPYHLNSPYTQVNITGFEIWGTNKIDYEQDDSYWLDEESVRAGAIYEVDPNTVLPERTFKDDWQYLGEFYYPNYQGNIAKTRELAQNGAEFEVNPDAEPVRYVRFFVKQVILSPPPLNNYFSLGEVTFYGDTSVPQE